MCIQKYLEIGAPLVFAPWSCCVSIVFVSQDSHRCRHMYLMFWKVVLNIQSELALCCQWHVTWSPYTSPRYAVFTNVTQLYRLELIWEYRHISHSMKGQSSRLLPRRACTCMHCQEPSNQLLVAQRPFSKSGENAVHHLTSLRNIMKFPSVTNRCHLIELWI